ncbi:hypothetical protein HDV02_002175 [Globomyces sp. JEL0801]|nr:hypothetical protein HDV02_002175 [Globomyces sp. JEL0801]
MRYSSSKIHFTYTRAFSSKVDSNELEWREVEIKNHTDLYELMKNNPQLNEEFDHTINHFPELCQVRDEMSNYMKKKQSGLNSKDPEFIRLRKKFQALLFKYGILTNVNADGTSPAPLNALFGPEGRRATVVTTNISPRRLGFEVKEEESNAWTKIQDKLVGYFTK